MFTTQSFKDRVIKLALFSACSLWIAGCDAPTKRLNAPPQGHTEHPHKPMQAHYTPMVDQALLADMSISSVHFVPHNSELNANGVRRLQRYSEILRTYGGTLHYDGVTDDKVLAEDRVKRIEDYLASAGLAPDQFKVERGLARGEGINADEAMTIRTGTYFQGGGGGGESDGGAVSVRDLLKGAGGKVGSR